MIGRQQAACLVAFFSAKVVLGFCAAAYSTGASIVQLDIQLLTGPKSRELFMAGTDGSACGSSCTRLSCEEARECFGARKAAAVRWKHFAHGVLAQLSVHVA